MEKRHFVSYLAAIFEAEYTLAGVLQKTEFGTILRDAVMRTHQIQCGVGVENQPQMEPM